MGRKILSPFTSRQLKNITERITRIRISLDTLADAMGSQGFTSLNIANQDTLDRAMKGLEKWDKAAWDAHHEARKLQGDYGPSNGKK